MSADATATTACRKCGAGPGDACTSPSGRRAVVHRVRLDAYHHDRPKGPDGNPLAPHYYVVASRLDRDTPCDRCKRPATDTIHLRPADPQCPGPGRAINVTGNDEPDRPAVA